MDKAQDIRSSRDSARYVATARLLIDADGRALKVGVQSDVFSIGADDACSLVLDRPGVAPRHAVIQRDGDRFEIFDLLSPAGTLVNGRRVEAAALTSGDAIRIGDARLVFLTDDVAPAPAFAAVPEGRPAVAAESPPLGFFEPPVEDVAARPESFSPPVDAPLNRPLTPPRRPRYVAYEHKSRADFPEFGEILVIQLRRTPFMATSFVAHAIVVLLMLLFSEKGEMPIVRGPVNTEFGAAADLEHTPPEARNPAPEIEAFADDAAPVAEPEVADAWDTLAVGPDVDDEAPPISTTDDLGPFRRSGGKAGDGSGAVELGGILGPARGDGPSLRGLSEELRGVGLDVVLVVDATGSMGLVIEDARRRVNDAVIVLSAVAPQFRLGLVAFRDRGDEFVVKSVKLTRRHFEVVDFLDGLKAEGGGDIEEAVDEALTEAITRMNFEPGGRRIVILVGDAPPHREKKSTAFSVAADFARRGGALHSVFCSRDARPNDDARTFFEELAKKGAGVSADLGAKQGLVETVLPIIFGEGYREPMTRAVHEATRGARAARWREFADGADATRIKRELSFEKASTPYLLAALALRPKPEHLAAFLDVLGDRDAPISLRWAAAVLVKRVIRASAPPEHLAALAESLSPADHPSRVSERIALIRAGAEKIGFKTAALPPVDRPKKK